MKLYDSKTAPNPRRVRIFLAEKGITVPTVQVDIANKENRTEDYIKTKNPMAGVPVLELDDGTVISETMAICRYFEALQPEPPLFGSGPKEKALVEMWSRRVELYVMNAVTGTFQHSSAFFADRIEQAPDYAKIQQKKVPEYLDWLEGVLADRPYLAGERYTVADINLLCTIDFARVIKARPDPERHKNLLRWHADVSARPSAQA